MTSHPIQYQAPWFRALAQVTDLEVLRELLSLRRRNTKPPLDHAA